jgi:hypothetical protein
VSYQIALDIVNRAIQHLIGVNRIYDLGDTTPVAREISFCYDKIRAAELRRAAWKFAIRRVVLRPVTTATVLWTPAAWAATTTYAAGAVVSYTPASLNVAEKGANPVPYLWYCGVPIAGLAANDPPDISTVWHRYFGPVTCEPFVSADSPPLAPTLGSSVAGALTGSTIFVKVVYVTTTGETLPSGESSLAVATNSVLVVTSPVAQTNATAYHVFAGLTAGEETLQTGTAAITLGTDWTEPTTGLVIGRGLPLAVTGANLPGFWSQEITLRGTAIYTSLYSSNVDAPPSGKWLAQGGTAAPLNILYPIGAGPSAQAGTRNVFRLPHGFLRKAPTDPAADTSEYDGVPSGIADEDWVFEGNYLISRVTGPLLVRFVSEMVDVYDFDPLFCEMVAARIATEVAGCNGVCAADVVNASMRNANAHYRSERSQAYQANSILVGRSATPTNRYMLARL